MRRRLREAKTLCESLSRTDGRDAEVWLLLGIANAELGAVREAAACCERALTLRSGYSEARITLGRLCANTGDRDRAISEFQHVLALQPGNPAVLTLLVPVLFDANRFAECLDACRDLVRAAPRSAEAHHWLGRAHAESGRLAEAEENYRRALSFDASYFPALQNLLEVVLAQGRTQESLECADAALAVRSDHAPTHLRRGDALLILGRREEALRSYAQAIALDSSIGPYFCRYGDLLAAAGRWDDAVAYLSDIARLVPACGEVLTDLGRALHFSGRSEEAIGMFRRAIGVAPGLAAAYNNLGAMLIEKSDLDQAIGCFREAIRLNPAFSDAHNNLGSAFMRQEMWSEALAACSEALRLQPAFAEALANIGNIHAKRSRHSEAVPWLERALAIKPQSAEMNNNLGCTLQKLGDVEGAVARFREAMRCDASNTDAPNNLVFTLNYLDSPDPAEVYAEHLRWAERYARKSHAPPVWKHVPDPERRLRVGYVSPDLWRHSVAYFFEPLLAAHDSATVEVFCYADVKKPDEVTERLRGLASGWRDTRQLSDEQLTTIVRSDKIDILVDLAGHTNDNRLGMFAHCGAPIQATYLGYPNTSGLASMDYRLTDAWTDPPGFTDSFNTETLVRLPRGFLCYQPDDCAPDPAPPPALANGYVTFGSFNNVMKTSSVVIRTWAAILKAVPASSLLLKNVVLHEALARDRIVCAFIEAGIDPARIQLDGFKAKRAHLDQYARLDIALDPFPYNGTTTSCESLWMGVPVLALAGKTHAGRVGVSLLSQLGLDEWIAGDEQDYVAKAVRFAADLPMLSALRASLRDRMRASSLMDAAGLARDIEATYRDMWRNWCRTRGSDFLPG